MKKLKYTIITMLSLLLCFIPCVSYASENSQGIDVPEYHATATTTSSLNVRSGPSKDYDVIQLLDAGTTVTITGKTETGWYQIQLDNQTGFVYSKYVTTPVEITEEETTKDEGSLPSLTQIKSFIDAPTVTMVIAGIVVVVILMIITLWQVNKLTKEISEPVQKRYQTFDEEDDFEEDEE